MATSLKLNLDELHLLKGGHNRRADGVCVMEAVAWAAGREHSDHPPCVCPSLGSTLRSFNDFMSDNERQDLKKYIYPVLGTAGDGFEAKRSWMVIDWSLRDVMPQVWDILKMPEQATELRALAEINDVVPLSAAILVLEKHKPLARALALALAFVASGEAEGRVAAPEVDALVARDAVDPRFERDIQAGARQ